MLNEEDRVLERDNSIVEGSPYGNEKNSSDDDEEQDVIVAIVEHTESKDEILRWYDQPKWICCFFLVIGITIALIVCGTLLLTRW